MPTLDIPVSEAVQQMLNIPPCIDLKPPKPLKITLPTGGALPAFTDLSRGVPTDCSLSFSVLLQLAPLLGSMDCLLKILKLLSPLIDVVKGLPFPPVEAIIKFGEAAKDLIPCLAVPVGGGICPFVKSILDLILRVLKCLLGQIKSIVGVLGGLSLHIQAAEGNPDLLKLLKCSQQNAEAAAASTLQAMEPIGVILDMVGPVMAIIGKDPIKLPQMGSDTNIEALNQVVTVLTQVVDSIQIVVDGLPC
jgi:hypothetical protein